MTQAAEPSRAQQARALIERRRYGVLATAFHKEAGQPYGSTAPYAVDAEGRPIFLFANLATHYRNLLLEPRASFVVWDEGLEREPMDSPRVTLIGRCLAVPEGEWKEAGALYFARFPETREFLGLGFEFFRLEIESIHWVGGFGGAGWPTVTDYRAAGR